ncbi:DNA repair protein RecO [Megasphaera vaginalis (ex Bordigoni et al. 2020)]|uniref:DNA repair protein RecO n=1 Tax=Megasphaera vaginalis (ex Bordigoni et al. 2020) TaxID=2045301 RepID=UPI000C7E0FBB|nr:DNA repair protein RecO C-terminal domain-containing protein [Megasphaera vaginalis (ex Bordigoni et al. 2020)]
MAKHKSGAPPGLPSRCDGIVLRVHKQAAKQLFLEIYTVQEGLLRVLTEKGRGVRKGMPAAPLPFSKISFEIYRQGNVRILSEYECAVNRYLQNLTWNEYVYSQIFTELFLALVPPQEADPALYRLLSQYADAVCVKDCRIVTIIAGWQLLSLTGFAPDPATVRLYRTGAAGAGETILSDEDAGAEWREERLTPAFRAFWRRVLEYDWDRRETVRFSAKGLALLEDLLYAYVSQCSERRLKSISFLSSL